MQARRLRGHREGPIRAALALVLSVVPTAAGADPAPRGFVDAATIVPSLKVEMRYAGAHNFVGRKVEGYEAPVCLLTRPAADALATVARDLSTRGLGLKVFDCYRPLRAVAHFMRWARNIGDLATKPEFYPQLDKRDLFRLGYIASPSAHSRGSTVDITLVRLSDGSELDMGTPFDHFSPRSWPSDPTVNAEARQNRKLLADAMRRGGFKANSKEWWHFTLAREPFAMGFDFPVK